MSKEGWLPVETKPRVKELREEIKRRARATNMAPQPRPSQWDWNKCVAWLGEHDHDDGADEANLLLLDDGNGDEDTREYVPVPLGPAAPTDTPSRHTRSAVRILGNSPPPPPKKNWKRAKMLPRLANVASAMRDVFLNRDATLNREQLDAREADEPYRLLALAFNDETNDFVNTNQFAGDDEVPEEVRALNPGPLDGYIITATKVKEELRLLRSTLERALAKFRTSGQGDGGGELSVEQREGEVFSSSFVDFIGGDWPLYYFYLLAIKNGLLKSALVTMPKEARHNGTSLSSTAQARQRKRDFASGLSEVSAALREEVPVRLVLSEDQHAEIAAKRRRAEIDAESAGVKLCDELFKSYAETNARLHDPALSPFSKQALELRKAQLQGQLRQATTARTQQTTAASTTTTTTVPPTTAAPTTTAPTTTTTAAQPNTSAFLLSDEDDMDEERDLDAEAQAAHEEWEDLNDDLHSMFGYVDKLKDPTELPPLYDEIDSPVTDLLDRLVDAILKPGFIGRVPAIKWLTNLCMWYPAYFDGFKTSCTRWCEALEFALGAEETDFEGL